MPKRPTDLPGQLDLAGDYVKKPDAACAKNNAWLWRAGA